MVAGLCVAAAGCFGDDSDGDDAPIIVEFGADSGPHRVGGDATLSWMTSGATTVSLSRVSPRPEELEAMAAAQGSVVVTLTATSTEFLLEATNSNGKTTMPLRVVVGVLPTITSFEVSPRTFTGASAAATITWATQHATSVDVTVGAHSVSTELGGTAMATVSGTVDVTIRATSAGGVVSQVITIGHLVAETEPNDDAASADELDGDGGGVAGRFAVVSDVDWYAVTVTEPGSSITAEVRDGAGNCDIDVMFQVFDVDAMTTLDFAVGRRGRGGCARADPHRRAALTRLSPGRYFIQVQAPRAQPNEAYSLTVHVKPPACGNGLVEHQNGEQCDDGNTGGGDDCNASCEFDVDGTAELRAGATETFTGALSFVGDIDTYRVEMPSPGYIRAETFAPSRPACDGVGTILTLHDASGRELGRDDHFGVGFCSRIAPLRVRGSRVEAGIYYLRVVEMLGLVEIPAYTLEVSMLELGCGNGVIESSPPEAESCDDGNTTPGDGCSTDCAYEGMRENEPNDTYTHAGDLTMMNEVTASGQISPAGDRDWYAITVPAGWSVETFITVDSLVDCPPPEPTMRVELYAPDGATPISSSTSNRGDKCGRISPIGQWRGDRVRNIGTDETFYVLVHEAGDAHVVQRYFLHVKLYPPECGNEIVDDVPAAMIAEICDDGNTVDGDGCNSSCEFEIAQVIQPPGGMFPVSFINAGAYQVFQLNLPTPGLSITATAADADGMCTVDTRIRLYRATGPTTSVGLGNNDASGPGLCAAIDPRTDAFASTLDAGIYGLVVDNQSMAPGVSQLSIRID